MVGISRLYCGLVEQSDALRYSRGGLGRKGGAPQARKPVVVWNSTMRCNLKCRHCYAAGGAAGHGRELSTAEAKRMIESLAAFGCPVLIFSGGEPCLREDLVELAAFARSLGMRAVLSTNGTLLGPSLAERLAAAGLSYVGVSIDGSETLHDSFRGVEGAFANALGGIRASKAAGLKVGLRMTLHRGNAGEIPGVFSLMKRLSLDRACFYHLVYSGRGSSMMSEDLSRAECRAAVRTIMDETKAWHADGGRPEILTVDNHADGPFVCLELQKENPAMAERAKALLETNGGNSSGDGIGCIGCDGEVYADQFWRSRSFGNVLERPFGEIWTSEELRPLKEKKKHVKGRCASCRWLGACGGNFRARAEAATGDPWAPDPACYLDDGEIA